MERSSLLYCWSNSSPPTSTSRMRVLVRMVASASSMPSNFLRTASRCYCPSTRNSPARTMTICKWQLPLAIASSAPNSVENLGKRTRAMSRKLKDVELLSDQPSAENLLGLSADEILDGAAGDGAAFGEEPAEITVRDPQATRVKH